MKVILITGSAPPQHCGVGDYTFHLGRELSKSHDVYIVTSEGARPVNEPHFKVLPIIKNWGASRSLAFLKTLREIRPDVLNIQYPTQGYTGWLAYFIPVVAFLMGIPVVQTWHEIYTSEDFKHLSVHGWVPGGIVIVRPRYFQLTNSIVRFLAKNKTIKFIPNGSSIPQSSLPFAEVKEMRTKLLGQQKRLLIFFGFVYEHKGVDSIFEVADPDRDQLVIIGHLDTKNDYQKKILDLAQSPMWKNKVHLLGFLNSGEVANYLRCSDLALFPFKGGAGEWNTSLHAAVKNGCPFVATTITEPLHRDNSYFVPANDLPAFKSAINKVIADSSFEMRNITNLDSRNEWNDIGIKHTELYLSLTKATNLALTKASHKVD